MLVKEKFDKTPPDGDLVAASSPTDSGGGTGPSSAGWEATVSE